MVLKSSEETLSTRHYYAYHPNFETGSSRTRSRTTTSISRMVTSIHLRSESRRHHMFGLLRACRQIYAKTRMLPFTLSTFECHTSPFAQRWHNAILERIKAIRCIKTKVYVPSDPAHRSFEAQCRFLALFDALDAIEVNVWHF